MNLQTPIKPKSYGVDRGIIQLTQLFGENHLNYSLLGLKGHNGWDFRTKHFQNGHAGVCAAHKGIIVSEKGKQSDTAGRFVKILSPETKYQGKACKIQTVYFHLSKCRHEKGAMVKAGMLIGIAGNTGGFTTGAHLHFGVYILWKQPNGTYKANTGNGYAGAIDPLELMIDWQVYQYGDSWWGRRFYHNGERISRAEVDDLIPKGYRT